MSDVGKTPGGYHADLKEREQMGQHGIPFRGMVGLQEGWRFLPLETKSTSSHFSNEPNPEQPEAGEEPEEDRLDDRMRGP